MKIISSTTKFLGCMMGGLSLLWTASVSAQSVTLPPSYVPQQQISGEIRVAGHGAKNPKKRNFVGKLLQEWEKGFKKFHPNIRLVNQLRGTANAMGQVYTGKADVALMGREIWPPEIAAHIEVKGYPPLGLDIITGSYNVRNHGYAIVFFVNKANPISQLSFEQLDAIFMAKSRRGTAPIRTWGDLGLTGEWKDKKINLYGISINRGFSRFLEDEIFQRNGIWNPSMKEFFDEKGTMGGKTDGGYKVIDAIAKDPQGLGYSGFLYENHTQVKPLALSPKAGAPFVMPTPETVANHSYPLIHKITMFLSRKPGTKVDPKLKEFFRYILSKEGQEAVVTHGGGYLPMSAELAAKELKKLD